MLFLFSLAAQNSFIMNDTQPCVKDIMTTAVYSVTPEDSFTKVKAIFQDHEFHHIPVINNDGQVVGIISKEDWRSRLEMVSTESTGETWTGKYLNGLKAADVMTPNPMVLDPEDTIGLAADIFLANRFHALPIVEDNQLQGMLTSHDLLRYAFQG